MNSLTICLCNPEASKPARWWRRTGRREVGRKSGQNGLSCAIFSAYSTRINAGIAQLVEQLICNQQVVGSNPTAGSLLKWVVLPKSTLFYCPYVAPITGLYLATDVRRSCLQLFVVSQ